MLCCTLIFITFVVSITFTVGITLSGDTQDNGTEILFAKHQLPTNIQLCHNGLEIAR